MTTDYEDETFEELLAALERKDEQISKLTWQVRDTCARAEKAEALLRECDSAINPPDRSGISLDVWNERLKAVTATIRDLFKASEPIRRT